MREVDAQRKASARVKKGSVRTNREDGDLTKARILDVAGRLFAERGYAETTSKEICEMAQTNITAVNYHFGSREGLYAAVIREMNEYFAKSHSVLDIDQTGSDAREKLALIIDRLASVAYKNSSWQVRLWAREKVAPSGLVDPSSRARAKPDMGFIGRLVAEITGIPREDPALDLCFLNVMAPFLVLLIMGGGLPMRDKPIFHSDVKTVSAHLKGFIFAGLDAFAAKYAKTGPGGAANS